MDSLYKQAEKAEKAGAFEEALELLQKIIEENPEEEHAYYSAANLYAIRGLVPQVIQQFLKLGEVLENKEQLDGALEVCNWVISIEPTSSQARLKLIELLEKKGNKQAAITQSLNLAKIFSAVGHGEKALELLQKQREDDPDNPDLLFQLGEIYIKQGQIGDGLALYKVVAKEMLKQENYPLCLDALKRIKVIKPDDIENLSSLGTVYIEMGKLEEAKLEFRQILRSDLNHIGALSQLGMIYKTLGAWEDAKLPFRKIAELAPDNPSGRESYAEISEVLGNQVDAIKHYLAAAELYEKEGNSTKAVELYQNILALDPDHTTAQKKLQTLNAPVVPKKRSIETNLNLRAAQKPVYSEIEEKKEDAEETANSPLILKTDLKSKYPPGKEKPAPFSKVKSSAPAPLESGIPRTKPGFKPILTRTKEEPFAPAAQELNPEEQTPLEVTKAQNETESVSPLETPKVVYVEQSAVAEPPIETPDQIQQPAVKESVYTDHTESVSSPQKESIAQKEPLPLQKRTLEIPTISSSVKSEQPSLIQPKPSSAIASLPENLSSDIQQLLKQNKIIPAIQLCKDALRENPENENLKIALGEIYFQNGLLDEALLLFKEASKNSRDYSVFKKMGEIFLLREDGDQWAEAFTQMAKIQISSGEMNNGIAALLQILAWNPEYHPARQVLIPALKESGLSLFSLYHFKLMVSSLESSNSISDLIQAYQQMIESNPEAFPIRHKLALCYQEMGRLSEAKQEFLILSTHYGSSRENDKEAEALERALELDSHDIGIIHRLKDVYSGLGKQEAAVKLELKLGDIAQEKGDLQGALSSYKKILDSTQDDPEALTRLIEVYIQQKNTEEALAAGKRLESLYEKMKEVKKRIELNKKLISLAPDSLALHESLARLYIQNNQNQEAVQEFMTIGHLSSSQALFDQAIEAYRHVLSLDGTNKDARYQLGVILSDHKNNLEAALSEFKKVRSFDPHHTAALSRLAKGYVSLEKFEIAMEYIHELIKLNSDNQSLIGEFLKETESKLEKDQDNQNLRLGVGLFLLKTREFDKAIREFQIIVKKSPELTLKGYLYQGACWEEKALLDKDDVLYQNALKVYKKGLELHGYKDEEYLELKYALGNLYEKLGKIQEALPYYQEILTVDMDYKDARERKKQLEEEIKSGKVTRLPSSRRQESIS